jgi:flagellar biosynthesis protein FliR
MIELAPALAGDVQAALLAAGIVFLRIGAAMALLPGFGEQFVPARVRLALAFAFTAIVTPAVAARLPDVSGLPGFAVLLAAETLSGLALGLVVRLTLLALEMAGSWAAQAGSLSQMFGTSGEPMPAMSHLLVMAGLCLAMMAGLHVRVASALILSYEAMPAGEFPGAGLMRDWSLAQFSTAFSLAFSLSAPFAIAALVYNLALGVINRAMPALMVSFVGAPALTAGALLLLAVAAPLMLSVWWGAASGILSDPFRVAP